MMRRALLSERRGTIMTCIEVSCSPLLSVSPLRVIIHTYMSNCGLLYCKATASMCEKHVYTSWSLQSAAELVKLGPRTVKTHCLWTQMLITFSAVRYVLLLLLTAEHVARTSCSARAAQDAVGSTHLI